jgi:hypothetical protein
MVPGARPSSVLKYLGVNYTPSECLESGALIAKLVKAVNRAKGLALKPLQKVKLTVERIIPKFLHGLILGSPKETRRQMADQQDRTVIKDILRLHPSTTDHVLYARKRDGGMGIPRLAQLVHLASLRSGLALLASGDVAVQAASMAGGLEDSLRNVAKSMRLNWPVTPKDLVRASLLNKSQESKDRESGIPRSRSQRLP